MPQDSTPTAPAPPPPLTYTHSTRAFTRLLGLIYSIAFLSWAAQSDALIGTNGILPAQDLIQNIKTYESRHHTTIAHLYPTLFRYGTLVDFIPSLSLLGALFGLLVTIGIAPGLPLLLCWLLYLSIATVADVFMNYQWDALLLETGLIALFLVPWRPAHGFAKLFPSPLHHPSPIARLLLYWLLFRLIFQSGLVKILGGDSSWLHLTALTYHYETQPLPHIGGWLLHQAPPWFHSLSCLIMHIIELLIPFAIFLGPTPRLIAAAAIIALMAAIFLTGNYNFFNLLTATLALPLIHDRAWLRLPIPRLPTASPHPRLPSPPLPWHHPAYIPSLLFAPIALLLTLLAADASLALRIRGYPRLAPPILQEIHSLAASWRSFNAYGLFQTMTRSRHEILFEISEDGHTWHPLHCKYKPDHHTHRPPAWVAPHQPRLDWQLWFAALVPDGYQWPRDAHRTAPLYWFTKLIHGLLQHKPPIWSLFHPPPIEIHRVRHIRAHRYHYRIAPLATCIYQGQWWTREHLGFFLHPTSLQPITSPPTHNPPPQPSQ